MANVLRARSIQVVFHFKLEITLLASFSFFGNNTFPESLSRDLSLFTFTPNAEAPLNSFFVFIPVKLIKLSLNEQPGILLHFHKRLGEISPSDQIHPVNLIILFQFSGIRR